MPYSSILYAFFCSTLLCLCDRLCHFPVFSLYAWCRTLGLYIPVRLLWQCFTFCPSSSRILDLHSKPNRDCNFQIKAKDNVIIAPLRRMGDWPYISRYSKFLH
jgi:hypothetical protein